MLKARVLYRIASVLLLLFAIGHTLGFRTTDPRWGVDAVVASMHSIQFDTQGFHRTYWDFYVGFGLFVSVFILFAAVLAWQLSMRAPMPGIAWSFAICFVVLTILTWVYFFLIPIIFTTAISLCLVAAAWLSRD